MIKIHKKKQPRWKKEQSQRQQQRHKKAVGWGLGFLSLVCGLIVLGKVVKEINRSVWRTDNCLTVIAVDNGVYKIESLSVTDGEQKSIVLEPNLIVQAPFGYGEYRLKSVFDLGQLDNHGGKLLIRALEGELALPIDGYVVNGKTNLSWWDRARKWWFSRLVLRKEAEINLLSGGVLTDEKQKDGSEVFRLSQVLIDELINEKFFDQKVVEEDYTVAVLNASGVEGVAARVGRMLTNLGMHVSLVGNLAEQQESQITISSERLAESYTVERLKNIVPVEKIFTGETADKRAEVVLIIGKDYTILD